MSDQITSAGTVRARRRPRPLQRALHALLAMVLLPITALGVITGAATAAGAATVSTATAATAVNSGGFPQWYEDNAGNRVEPCIDPNDPNCVVLASTTFDPTKPVSFPTNYPDEFFYALADTSLTTPGCDVAGIAPGTARLTVALEGAFVNGAVVAADRQVFGRVRATVKGGLCPNTTYQFKHPYGVMTLKTDANGWVRVNNPAATQDVGCLVPTATNPCNFSDALPSPVFGTAANGGFLRWDPAVAPAAPAGYLGDGPGPGGVPTPHAITGGTNGNEFRILDSTGNDLATPTATNLFTVAGKLAGPLTTGADVVDFGGQTVDTTSATRTITVKNLDKATVTLQDATFEGTDKGMFAFVAGGTCAAGQTLARDASCTYDVTFTPTRNGAVSASLSVPFTGSFRSPFNQALTGFGQLVGQAPAVSLSSASLAFGNVRLKTASSPLTVTVTNSGTAPLAVSAVHFDPATTPHQDQYRITGNTCVSGVTVAPGGNCAIEVTMVPFAVGAHPTALQIVSNTATAVDTVAITGTATGGVAAVSPSVDSVNGFPEWYRDEAGVKLAQCLDPTDPYCVVLADPFYDPAQPMVWTSNYPGEFFYQVVDSDPALTINDPSCTTTVGKGSVRTAVEGSFLTGAPVPGDQITFGRVRFFVRDGLCPDTDYVFTSPYGADTFRTNAKGGLTRIAGTNDVGCLVFTPPATCDFAAAIPSRVLGGFLRWDPAVAPAAPAGYLGDAVNVHKIVGAPFSEDGITPANYFKIARADDPTAVVAFTDQFSVMGKLRGPLESDVASLDLGAVAQGSTSAPQTATFTNTGLDPITIDTTTVAGPDAAQFTLSDNTCVGATIAVNGTCTVSAVFSPTAPGAHAAQLEVTHSGLNSPVVVKLLGTGGAVGSAANISFAPRNVAFTPLHVGRSSAVQTVTVSNAGGTLPLSVLGASITGANSTEFSIVDNRCQADVAPDASCQIDVVFAPNTAGAKTASLALTDNAPGATHSVALTGTGSSATAAVSATRDAGNGFPMWYQDSNGTRLEACLDPASTHCVLLAGPGYNPANPITFPTNFPNEFFYGLADSALVTTPGCPAAGIPAGTAFTRLALEGTFATGTATAGQQATFGRVRVVASGLCPSAPYTFRTPFGLVTITTDTSGGIRPTAGTTDTGVVAGDFTTAVGSFSANSWLQDDPNVAPAPPAGYLGAGQAAVFHKVVGGTFVPLGANGPTNDFAVADSAGNILASTSQFSVAAKVAGPLQTETSALDFGHVASGNTSGTKTVTVTNVGAAATLGTIATAGTNADQFKVVAGGTCAANGALAADASCTVTVQFAPTTTGTKSGQLRVTTTAGATLVVTLTGIGDPAAAPVASVTPGVLAFGTTTPTAPVRLFTTVTNTGTANLSITKTAISGTNTADFTLDTVTANGATANCGTVPVTVVPGAKCSIAVVFKPTALGTRTGSLVITHNAVPSPTTVSLTGTGNGNSFTVQSAGFTKVKVNTAKDLTVGIKNGSTQSVLLTPYTVNGDPTVSSTITGTQKGFFQVLNGGAGCLGTTLAAGKSCNITVRFIPTVVGANYSATLSIKGDGNSLPPIVTSSLTGQGQ